MAVHSISVGHSKPILGSSFAAGDFNSNYNVLIHCYSKQKQCYGASYQIYFDGFVFTIHLISKLTNLQKMDLVKIELESKGTALSSK